MARAPGRTMTKAELSQELERVTRERDELAAALTKANECAALVAQQATGLSETGSPDMVARRIVLRRDTWDAVVARSKALEARGIRQLPAEVATILLEAGLSAIDRGAEPGLPELAEALKHASALVTNLTQAQEKQKAETRALLTRIAELEARPAVAVDTLEVGNLKRELDECRKELGAKQAEFAKLSAEHEECKGNLECESCDKERAIYCEDHDPHTCESACTDCGSPATYCGACGETGNLVRWACGMGATLVDLLPLAVTDEGRDAIRCACVEAIPTAPQGTFAFDGPAS